MKTHSTALKYYVAIAASIFLGIINGSVIAQKTDCVQCGNNNNTGVYSTTLGKNITAEDYYSFASGYEVLSSNTCSFAHGSFLTASGSNSVAIGSFAIAEKSSSMVLGFGYNNDNRLRNDITNSLMIGFGSNAPTFFVEGYHGMNRTGHIGIGNVADPQAKLHIREDESYDEASVYIQASNPERPAYLWLGTKNYGLQKQSASLEFLSDGDYVFSGGNVGIGTTIPPSQKLEVKGNIKQANRYYIETEKIQSFSRDGLKLFTTYGSGIFIDERGQVGIAKTNPGATLDVVV